jgi:hypothetical protein
MFVESGVDRISSEELVAALNARQIHSVSEQPWSARYLSKALRSAGITPLNIRLGDRVVKGYKAESFGLTTQSHEETAVQRSRSTKPAIVPPNQEPITTTEPRDSIERYLPVPLENLLQALETIPDERIHRFVAAVHDPDRQSYSLSELCREIGIQPREIGEAWKAYQLNIGLARMFAHLPQVLDDTVVDARSNDVLCPECGGTGEIVNEKTRKRTSCTVCVGVGKTRIVVIKGRGAGF